MSSLKAKTKEYFEALEQVYDEAGIDEIKSRITEKYIYSPTKNIDRLINERLEEEKDDREDEA